MVTVLVVAGAMLFGLWLAKSSVDSTFKDYEVVFNEPVTGLSKGSAVQYSGIKVGDVTSLHLDPADPRRVLARIRLNAETPVKQDTQAKLTLTGVTGTSLIQLSGGTPDSPPLLGKGNKLPVIIASPSPIARLLTNSSEETAWQAAERIRQRVYDLKIPHMFNESVATNVTISIGLTPLIDDNIEQALARADGALYEAKNKGRNIILAS
jgi:ABC-type transporter Mla subunit MlaD